MKISIRPLDVLIFGAFAFLGLFLLLNSARRAFSAGGVLRVYADGIEYEYPLGEDRTIEVEGVLGTTKIELKNSRARIVDSPCPNRICVSMGSVGRGSPGSLVCLPNDVIVSVGSLVEDGEFDALAR